MPLHSSHYWLLRAEEARAMAEDMQDQVAKQATMEIVATYEKLAGYTRALEKRRAAAPSSLPLVNNGMPRRAASSR